MIRQILESNPFLLDNKDNTQVIGFMGCIEELKCIKGSTYYTNIDKTIDDIINIVKRLCTFEINIKYDESILLSPVLSVVKNQVINDVDIDNIITSIFNIILSTNLEGIIKDNQNKYDLVGING